MGVASGLVHLYLLLLAMVGEVSLNVEVVRAALGGVLVNCIRGFSHLRHRVVVNDNWATLDDVDGFTDDIIRW